MRTRRNEILGRPKKQRLRRNAKFKGYVLNRLHTVLLFLDSDNLRSPHSVRQKLRVFIATQQTFGGWMLKAALSHNPAFHGRTYTPGFNPDPPLSPTPTLTQGRASPRGGSVMSEDAMPNLEHRLAHTADCLTAHVSPFHPPHGAVDHASAHAMIAACQGARCAPVVRVSEKRAQTLYDFFHDNGCYRGRTVPHSPRSGQSASLFSCGICNTP